MRAIIITEPGGPDVLDVGDRPARYPDAGEVRIRVRAAAVNPTDIGLRQNGGGETHRPWTPGMDAAGTVEAVGADVERLSEGDDVMAVVSPRRGDGGAQQELLVVNAGSVVSIPDGATLEQASTLPMNGLTARLGLGLLALEPGETLAVTGGAGLLASYVIPLAKADGIRVIADAKPEDEALVKRFGADIVVPRGDEFVDAVREHAPDGAHGLYDTALLTDSVVGAVRDGGVITVVRGWQAEPPGRGIEVRPTSVFSVLERTHWLEEIRDMAGDGRIQMRVAGTYPPEEVAEAHRVMDAGGLRGRAVIVF